MKWFNNLKIRYKFFLVAVVNIPFVLMLALAGIWGAGQINTLLESVEHKDLVAIYQLAQTKALILEARIAGRQALLESSPTLIKTNIDNSRSKRVQALENWQRYTALPLTSQARDASKSFPTYWQNFVNEYDQIYQWAELHNPQSLEKGVELLDQNNGRNLIANLDNLVSLQQAEAQATEKEANATFSQITLFILFFAFAMIALFFGTVGWVVQLVSKPISQARKVAMSIANGDLSQRLEVSSHDEIGELATSFNQMTDNLALAHKMRQQVSSAVKTKVMVMTEELRSTAHQQASGSEEQAAALSQVNQSVKELAVTANNIADLAQQVNQAAQLVALNSNEIEQTTHLAALQSNRGLEVVVSTREISREVAELYKQLVENMYNLSSKTARMSLILELLNSISHETHILSLNAAIEAAGAGDSGERFRVIAYQVRDLANRANTASQEVANLVRSIEDDTQVALHSAQNGNQKALDLEQAAREAGAIIEMLRNVTQQSEQQANSIHSVAEQTNQITQVIKITTTQQLTSNEQVLEALNNLSIIARQVAEGSYLVSTTAVQLDDITREVEAALV